MGWTADLRMAFSLTPPLSKGKGHGNWNWSEDISFMPFVPFSGNKWIDDLSPAHDCNVRSVINDEARPNSPFHPFPSCPKPSLCFKARPGAQPFTWKRVQFACEWNLIFIWKVGTKTCFEKEDKSNSEMAYCAPNPPCPNKQNRKKNRLVFVKRIYCLNCLLILPSLILRVFSRIFEPELKKAKCVSEFDRRGLVKWFLQFRATFVTKACVKRRNKATLNWNSVWESLIRSNSSCHKYPVSRK